MHSLQIVYFHLAQKYSVQILYFSSGRHVCSADCVLSPGGQALSVSIVSFARPKSTWCKRCNLSPGPGIFFPRPTITSGRYCIFLSAHVYLVQIYYTPCPEFVSCTSHKHVSKVWQGTCIARDGGSQKRHAILKPLNEART